MTATGALPLYTVAPFVALLLAIALLPIGLPHWWESNRSKLIVSLLAGLPIFALAQKVRGLRDKIVAIRAHLEAEIDFSDEDIRLPSRRQLAGEIERIIGDVTILHDSFARGRLARDGARAAIRACSIFSSAPTGRS